MFRRPSASLFAASLLMSGLALSGCGGDAVDPSNEGATLSLISTFDFNGTDRGFTPTSATATSNTSTGALSIAMTDGTRTFTVVLPSTSPSANTTYAIGGGAAMTLSDGGTWTATTGSLTVLSNSNDRLEIRFENIGFVPGAATTSFTPTGSFVLDGTVAGLPRTGSVDDGGGDDGGGDNTPEGINLTFGSGSDSNANLTAFGAGATYRFVNNGTSVSITLTESPETNATRTLLLTLPGVTNSLATGTFSATDTTGPTLIYQETNSGTTRQWRGNGGTWAVTQLTSSQISLTLSNIPMVSGNENAAGSFTINGTINR